VKVPVLGTFTWGKTKIRQVVKTATCQKSALTVVKCQNGTLPKEDSPQVPKLGTCHRDQTSKYQIDTLNGYYRKLPN